MIWFLFSKFSYIPTTDFRLLINTSIKKWSIKIVISIFSVLYRFSKSRDAFVDPTKIEFDSGSKIIGKPKSLFFENNWNTNLLFFISDDLINNLISIALKLIEVIFLVILSFEFFDLFLICILFKIFLSYLNFSSSFNGVIDNYLLL